MLARMFEGDLEPSCKDSSGRYFIDRDGSAFQHVLTYLRGEKLPPAAFGADRLHLDAEYYQVRAAEPVALQTAPLQSCRTDTPTVLQLDGLGELCKDNMPYAVCVKRAHAAAVEAAGQPFQDAKTYVIEGYWKALREGQPCFTDGAIALAVDAQALGVVRTILENLLLFNMELRLAGYTHCIGFRPIGYKSYVSTPSVVVALSAKGFSPKANLHEPYRWSMSLSVKRPDEIYGCWLSPSGSYLEPGSTEIRVCCRGARSHGEEGSNSLMMHYNQTNDTNFEILRS